MDNQPPWSRWEDISGDPAPLSFGGLCQMLPEELYVLYDPVRYRYCYRTLACTEDCGLLAFSKPRLAHAYLASSSAGAAYTQVWAVTLGQACQMAQERHAVVNSVILLDDLHKPVVQYVR